MPAIFDSAIAKLRRINFLWMDIALLCMVTCSLVCSDKGSVEVPGYQAKPAILDPAIVKLRRINFSFRSFARSSRMFIRRLNSYIIV